VQTISLRLLRRNAVAYLAPFIALGGTSLAACGDDDDDGGGGGGGADVAPLSIDVNDQGIDAPQSIEAGLVKITLTNSGLGPHEAQLIRIAGGHTADQALDVVTGGEEASGIPDWVSGAGGVGTTKPAATGTVMQVLEPGSYAIIDTEPHNPVNAELEVTREAGEAELPKAVATVTASEYTFETSGLKAGDPILFENTGKQLHHLFASPVKQGTTAAQVIKYFKTEEKGANPFRGGEEAAVGTSVIDSGMSQVVDLELKAGSYAFVCFIPDRAGGPPHALKGVVTIEEVQ
jgi:plastocyanin